MRTREPVLNHEKLLTTIFILWQFTFLHTEVVVSFIILKWVLVEDGLALAISRVGFLLGRGAARVTVILAYFIQIFILQYRIFLFLNDDAILRLINFITVIRVNAQILKLCMELFATATTRFNVVLNHSASAVVFFSTNFESVGLRLLLQLLIIKSSPHNRRHRVVGLLLLRWQILLSTTVLLAINVNGFSRLQ